MVDSTYQPKVFKTDGGDALKVASGGHIDVETGGEFRIAGTAITASAAEINAAAGTGVSSTELDLLDGALAGVAVASKAAVHDANGKLFMSSASPAAAGTTVADATALTKQFNTVTGATGGAAGGAGVLLPVAAADEVVVVVNTDATNALKVYAITGSQVNALGSTVAYLVTPGQMAIFVGRSATLWYTAAATDTIAGLTASAAELNYNDITTLGTGAASKAVVLDAGDDYTWPATGILKTGVLKDAANTTLGATNAEINNAADVSARTQELTASGAVTAGVQSVELNHATVVIAATIANANAHQGLFIVKDTSATGTAEHTLTLSAGTFNGTNNVATFNARDDALVIYFDSTGRGTILVNIGSVALS